MQTTSGQYLLIVFTLACPENSAASYGTLMRSALHTMLKDSGFNVSSSGKEAQICASYMLESLSTAENHTAEAAVQKIVSALSWPLVLVGVTRCGDCFTKQETPPNSLLPGRN